MSAAEFDDGFGTIREVLEIAGDVVGEVDGRVDGLYLTTRSLSVHVSTQDDAERLAKLLVLGDVRAFEATDDRSGFTVWSGGDIPAPHFQVLCTGPLTRPVRAYSPLMDVVIPYDVVGGEVA
ncbi:MAG: hypothetical protein FWF90_13340 [Promicromonosporaceae bacterium]|nr:hypothetical protein [Promicromonosporaceae bacterium]